MKILSLTRNDYGQIIAEVLNCGKIIKVFASTKRDLVKAITKVCYYTSKDEVMDDLDMNYADFS